VPTFKVGALGEDGCELRMRCALEVTSFRRSYGGTRESRLRGEDAAYPFGTYGPRVYQAAPTEPEAGPGALLALPGPRNLEEALGAHGLDEGSRERRNALLDDVRVTQRDEAEEIADAECLDFETDDLHSVPARPADTERRAAETRHRFANMRDVDDTSEHPQRLIIERDRRLGGRASFDPPG